LITLIIDIHPFARPRQIGRTDIDGLWKDLFSLVFDCASICLSRGSQTPCPARRRHTNKSLHSRCQSAFAQHLCKWRNWFQRPARRILGFSQWMG
jgi:hypothetical protein